MEPIYNTRFPSRRHTAITSHFQKLHGRAYTHTPYTHKPHNAQRHTHRKHSGPQATYRRKVPLGCSIPSFWNRDSYVLLMANSISRASDSSQLTSFASP